MNWMQASAIVISAASLVLSGLTIRWSRQARRNWEQVAELRAETRRIQGQ